MTYIWLVVGFVLLIKGAGLVRRQCLDDCQKIEHFADHHRFDDYCVRDECA